MNNTIKAIKPSEVGALQDNGIPDVVIETFNQFITKKYRGGSAIVVQDEVVEALVKKGLKRNKIFENGWMDVENIFRAQGWKVEHDKPAYCEDYNAYFIFRS